MTLPAPVQSLQEVCEIYANDISTRLKDGEKLRPIMNDFQSLFVTDKHQGIDVFDTMTVVATVTAEGTRFWIEVIAIDKETNESKKRKAYVRRK